MGNDNFMGKVCRDTVTGFAGTAIARVEYLNGCIQYCLQPYADEGKMPDACYIDYHQLEIVSEGLARQPAGTGGPQPNTPPAGYRG